MLSSSQPMLPLVAMGLNVASTLSSCTSRRLRAMTRNSRKSISSGCSPESLGPRRGRQSLEACFCSCFASCCTCNPKTCTSALLTSENFRRNSSTWQAGASFRKSCEKRMKDFLSRETSGLEKPSEWRKMTSTQTKASKSSLPPRGSVPIMARASCIMSCMGVRPTEDSNFRRESTEISPALSASNMSNLLKVPHSWSRSCL
mmetsp:Transcript_57369/g.129116  ORF Transcript_57369/g.129116 Transcript_57369/m.129116 type:complete len:202 (-) Transcript_57369:348-953(-)